MKKLGWLVWVVALVYNVYGSWVLGGGLVRIFREAGIVPQSLSEVRSDALMTGPIFSLIAMLWSLTWLRKTGR